jgi:hypothetical protein
VGPSRHPGDGCSLSPNALSINIPSHTDGQASDVLSTQIPPLQIPSIQVSSTVHAVPVAVRATHVLDAPHVSSAEQSK